MASVVLGKRTRSSVQNRDETIDATVASKRQRCVAPVTVNDENRNPFEADNPFEAHVEIVAKKARTSPIAPPTTINAHFRASKPTVDVNVYQDRKSDPTRTPSTPRHRDALSKKVPVTPRHRALLASGQKTPSTPRTPASPITAIYNQARQLFSRCSNPGKLVGRETEREQLAAFVRREGGGCLYISGPPGTGKSALVDDVLQEHRVNGERKIAAINCMSVRNARDLATQLSSDLDLAAPNSVASDKADAYLRSCFSASTTTYLVILDELDSLDPALLASLFETALLPSSRLRLIGIANQLDLTSRLLPRLGGTSLKPEVLPFMPYSAVQIARILTEKVRDVMSEGEAVLPFLHPAAIQFCAKKVAGQTGDIRKAFDICRRAMEVVEQEVRTQSLPGTPSKTPLMEKINLASPSSPRSPVYTIQTAPRATIAHVAAVTATAFTASNTASRLGHLNLQQKAVLCSLSALERSNVQRKIFAPSTPSKKTGGGSTVRVLYESYAELCTREKLLHPLSAAEFRDVVSGLEVLGLLTAMTAQSSGPSGLRTPSRKGKGGFGTAAGGGGDERRVLGCVGTEELRKSLVGTVGGDGLREMLEGGL